MSMASNIPTSTGFSITLSGQVGVIPPAALVMALELRSLLLLEYVHVISGGTRTGFDLFMSVILGRILASLDLPGRVEVAKRLTPYPDRIFKREILILLGIYPVTGEVPCYLILNLKIIVTTYLIGKRNSHS